MSPHDIILPNLSPFRDCHRLYLIHMNHVDCGPFGTLILPATPSTLKHGKLVYENFCETFVVIAKIDMHGYPCHVWRQPCGTLFAKADMNSKRMIVHGMQEFAVSHV